MLLLIQLVIWHRATASPPRSAAGVDGTVTPASAERLSVHLNQAALVLSYAAFLTLAVVLKPVTYERLR